MTIDQQIELMRLRSELEKSNRVGAALADQLQRSIARNSRFVKAMTLIADIADGSTTANSLPHISKIARAEIKGTDNAN